MSLLKVPVDGATHTTTKLPLTAVVRSRNITVLSVNTLSASHMPGTVLGSEDSAVNKTGKVPALMELTF